MKKTIYQIMRERIMYLEYKPGEILNEKVLAEEFEVSRSPIKDVLSRLEWEQLLRVIPRTGSMVSEIEFSRVMNAYQVRFEIECFEATIAEGQFFSKHITKLHELHEKCKNLLKNEDPKALTEIDGSLRCLIHDAAGNQVLADVSERLYMQTFRLWYSVLIKSDWTEEVTAVIKELETLIEYFASGSSNEFGIIRKTQLVKHLERLRYKFLGSLERPA